MIDLICGMGGFFSRKPKGEQLRQGVPRGRYSAKLYASEDARLQGDAPIWEAEGKNGITDEGIHYLLEVGFRSDDMAPVSQIAPWYAGLIDDDSFTGVAAGDEMDDHSTWLESDDYDESARPTLVFAAAALRAIGAQVAFTLNATKTLRGIFISSDDTKDGTTGTLWATALFVSPPTVVSGNVLTVNYSLTD